MLHSVFHKLLILKFNTPNSCDIIGYPDARNLDRGKEIITTVAYLALEYRKTFLGCQ